jgi:hypothetical protein
MNHAFDRHFEASFKLKGSLQSNLAMVDAKIYELQEKYFIDKRVPAETYDRLRNKLAGEKKKILEKLSSTDIDSSNLKETFEWAINISLKLPLIWDSSKVTVKEKLQKMVFSNGISYYHKNGTFLTDNINEVFKPIPLLNCISESDKNKQGSIAATLSNLVGSAEFEPAYNILNINPENATLIYSLLYSRLYEA